MTTGQQVIDDVRHTLHDEDPLCYRWDDNELLGYINAGQRKIVTLVPDANVVQESVTLTANQARQILPTGGLKFMKCTTNYAGAVPKASLRYVEKDALDSWDPDWEYSSSTPGTDFHKHYAHDKREPTIFYVYPVGNTATTVGVVFSKLPTDLSSIASDLALGDDYYDALVMYVIFRALAKEGRYTLPSSVHREHYDRFLQALGLQATAEGEVSPENNRAPDLG